MVEKLGIKKIWIKKVQQYFDPKILAKALKKYERLGLLAEPCLTPRPPVNLGPVIWYMAEMTKSYQNILWRPKSLGMDFFPGPKEKFETPLQPFWIIRYQ